MSIRYSFQKKWKTFFAVIIFLLALSAGVFYLVEVYNKEGVEKFIYSAILVASIFVGSSYIILFAFRKAYEKRNDNVAKKLKRRLEKFRNTTNYITPFILLAMLYHFWIIKWYLAVVIIIVLLLDRLNELRRNIK